MLSRVTQNRLILVGIWPSRQKICQHAQTAACLRLRHPWCPGSKSTTIATVTSGRNATYRNLLTQKKDRERGHGPVFKVAKCVSRSPGTSPYYFFEGSLQCELQGQLRIAPTYASSVVTLQVYFPRSESPRRRRRRRGCHKQVGGMLPESTYLALLIQETREGIAPFPRLLPKVEIANVFHVIRAPSIYCFFEGSLQCELLLLLQHASPSTSQVFCLDRIAPTYAIIHGHFAVVPSESGHVQSAALPLSLRHPCCLTPESGWKSTYLAVYFHRETKRGHGSITKAPA